MANAKIIEQKAQHVAEIVERIKKAQSVIIFDYCGLTVEEDTALRTSMRKAGVEYMVLKNTLVARAMNDAGIDESIRPVLNGTSAFAFGYSDPVTPAKILKDAIGKYKKCAFKGGVVDGKVVDVATIEALADLPSREQMLARMLGSMMSPITKLAIGLDQVAKQKAEQ